MYNCIRRTIDSLDASLLHQYIVEIPAGRWCECNITGSPYIKLVGKGIGQTILYVDGNSSKVTPSDYSFSQYANTPLKEVPQSFKHIFNIQKSCQVENMTLITEEAKYCIHLDNPAFESASFSGCELIKKGNVNYHIGIGIWGERFGQRIYIRDCTFRGEYKEKAIFIHNWNNQKYPTFCKIENSYFDNCDYLLADELGSEQKDIIELINCSTSEIGSIGWYVDQMSDKSTYWTNPQTGTKEKDPQKLPYCIEVRAIDTKVSYVHAIGWEDLPQSCRPEAFKYVKGGYSKEVESIGDINCYDCLSLSADGAVCRYDGSLPFYGVALNSSDNGKVYVVEKGKLLDLYGPLSSGHSSGKYVKATPQGVLETTHDSKNAVGCVLDTDRNKITVWLIDPDQNVKLSDTLIPSAWMPGLFK